MNVLIVDDSRFVCLMNQRALVKAGFEVLSAADGEEGLCLAIEHKPDLVVLDMMLPKLSGPDVLQALRKDPRTADLIPVMVPTSLPQRNAQKLVSEGATSYFEKSGLNLDQGSGFFVDAVQKCSPKPKRPAAEISAGENITETLRRNSPRVRVIDFIVCHERPRLLRPRYSHATRRQLRRCSCCG